ncbi:hypothetical protein [Deinococcus cellulosilyticus]|uniref:Uncharacterized protein n=1 Tax=Deinococcus cellulosilyticus (strain DSM 18568 / NBRC 106333 / KACC 11606 / 5516J-15) TaxID=1223518 RepID=A0A511N5Q4_DEIC1|nr:hypothetical protein [Deinococcus cellulosilyticus]GEM48192.1 hypothetical protein DC3_38270 [Deinococcus cellulosilyticus NBRC 106333 = KACC 11606]
MTDSHKPLLKVMTDYHCWPLWISTPQDYFNVEPQDLNLPPELSQALIDWATDFDDILNMDDPASSAFPSPEAEEAFVVLGMELARQVKALLSERYEVMYFDLLKRRLVEVP